MNLNATFAARIVRRFDAIPTSAAILWRCGPRPVRALACWTPDNAPVYFEFHNGAAAGDALAFAT